MTKDEIKKLVLGEVASRCLWLAVNDTILTTMPNLDLSTMEKKYLHDSYMEIRNDLMKQADKLRGHRFTSTFDKQ